MKPILLIDFGSTYTKVLAVDPDAGRVIGTADSYTTVTTDVSIGLADALTKLARQIGTREFSERYACSSAAGGLRMIASGLVPSLTSEAAKRAALGAGAKVVKTYAYELTYDDTEEIARLAPDILLLCGGTDGGNRACVEHNARMVAQMDYRCPVVMAGNRAARRACEQALAGREVIAAGNVMAEFGRLNVEPTQAVIRELFLKRIIRAKGLSQAAELISGILMPTPAAVLEALTLLKEDMGELMAVDLGGATTDIYSITAGLPTRPNTVLRGLPEPYAKRTVEGDIGMRYSAQGIVDAVGIEALTEAAGRDAQTVRRWLDRIHAEPGVLPAKPEESDVDFALATLAIELGLSRHAGTIEQVYTPMGVAYQQTGKDLTEIRALLLTGGALAHSPRVEQMARRAMAAPDHMCSLMPRDARVFIDRRYILSAMGILSQNHPQLARSIMMKEFVYGDSQ